VGVEKSSTPISEVISPMQKNESKKEFLEASFKLILPFLPLLIACGYPFLE